nr:MAG TPA: hypothetical protein [Caudoviricetes sp.]
MSLFRSLIVNDTLTPPEITEESFEGTFNVTVGSKFYTVSTSSTHYYDYTNIGYSNNVIGSISPQSFQLKKLGTVSISDVRSTYYSNVNSEIYDNLDNETGIIFETSEKTYKTTIECTVTRLDTNASVSSTYTTRGMGTRYNLYPNTVFFTDSDVGKTIPIKITLTARYSELPQPTHYVTVGKSGRYYGYNEGAYGSITPVTLTDSTGTYTWNNFSKLYNNSRNIYFEASNITLTTGTRLRFDKLHIVRLDTYESIDGVTSINIDSNGEMSGNFSIKEEFFTSADVGKTIPINLMLHLR